MRSRTSPAMRLRNIPAATRKACRPTPGCAAGAGGPPGLVEVVTRVCVPSTLFINENTTFCGRNYSARSIWNLHYTGERRTSVVEGTTHAFEQHFQFFGDDGFSGLRSRFHGRAGS